MGLFDFGRKFINSMPLMGGITSNIWGDPNQEAHQRSFDEAQKLMAKQRAYMMDGRMNAMNQSALAFGPRNQMLGEMMGKGQGQNAMDLAPMLQNPMTQQHQTDIRQAAFGGPVPPSPMSREEQAIRGQGQFRRR